MKMTLFPVPLLDLHSRKSTEKLKDSPREIPSITRTTEYKQNNPLHPWLLSFFKRRLAEKFISKYIVLLFRQFYGMDFMLLTRHELASRPLIPIHREKFASRPYSSFSMP